MQRSGVLLDWLGEGGGSRSPRAAHLQAATARTEIPLLLQCSALNAGRGWYDNQRWLRLNFS